MTIKSFMKAGPSIRPMGTLFSSLRKEVCAGVTAAACFLSLNQPLWAQTSNGAPTGFFGATIVSSNARVVSASETQTAAGTVVASKNGLGTLNAQKTYDLDVPFPVNLQVGRAIEPYSAHIVINRPSPGDVYWYRLPYTISVVGGELPEGMSLRQNSAGNPSYDQLAHFCGTPTKAGTYEVTLRATMADGAVTADKVVPLTIAESSVSADETVVSQFLSQLKVYGSPDVFAYAANRGGSLIDWDPSYPSTDHYQLFQHNSVASAKLVLTVKNQRTVVTVNGQPLDWVELTGYKTLPLELGLNTFNVEFTAADGVTKRTFTLDIQRSTALESTAGLSSLSLEGLSLSPAFSPDVTDYSVSLPAGTRSIGILAKSTAPDLTNILVPPMIALISNREPLPKLDTDSLPGLYEPIIGGRSEVVFSTPSNISIMTFSSDGFARKFYNIKVLSADSFQPLPSITSGEQPSSNEVLLNGDFERGPQVDPSTWYVLNKGDESLGWKVETGSIEIDTCWNAASGSRSIDLNGNDQGMISQTIPTVPGRSYWVSFDLSGNPYGESPLKGVIVCGGDRNQAQIFYYDTSLKQNDSGNMRWERRAYSFVAKEEKTKLLFASSISGSCGPVLDNISVSTTEPNLVNGGEWLTPHLSGDRVDGFVLTDPTGILLPNSGDPSVAAPDEWIKIPSVAQYGGADWKNLMQWSHNVTLEEAKLIASKNPDISFFFYENWGMALQSPSGEWRILQPGDALFFNGTPWWGSTDGQADGYIRRTSQPNEPNPSPEVPGIPLIDPMIVIDDGKNLVTDPIIQLPEPPVLSVPPSIDQQPSSAKVLANGKVTLSIAASGSGELTYQWRKDGQPMEGQTAPELYLRATEKAAGLYTVLVSNEVGSTESQAAAIEILPAAQLKGVYQGLLTGDSEDGAAVGRITVTMTGQTGFSGKLDYAGVTYRFSGALDETWSFQKTITAKRKPEVNLEITLSDSADALSITVSGGQLGEDAVSFASLQRTQFDAANSVVAVGSRFTALLETSEALSWGYCTATLGKTGILNVTGKSADGAPLVCNAYLQSNGTVALYAELFGAHHPYPGQICGSVVLNKENTEEFNQLTEITFPKPEQGLVTTYDSIQSISLKSSLYKAPKAKQRVLNLGEAPSPLELWVLDNTGEEFASQVTLSADNKFEEVDPRPLRFRVKLDSATGVISGKYSDPDSGVSWKVFGVVLQSENRLGGFWYGNGDTGSWSLTPSEPEIAP